MTMSRFIERYWERIVEAIFTHMFYVLVSVAIAFAIAFVIGVSLSRVPKWAAIMIPALSLFQTIPGIVFLGVLFLYTGMRPGTVIIALAIYALFPILKNTYVGLVEVPAEYKEAAKGCGMSAIQSLVRVEIPMALPTIISGLRMSLVYTVSWATLSAMIGMGGLGEFIYSGISSNDNRLILAGAIPAALLAVICSKLVDIVRIKLIPKPLRRDLK
jgi:ABC-type proline/glycine betaine transport systems, permease component